MGLQVYKNTYEMGHATYDGVSFHESDIMPTLKAMFDVVEKQIKEDGGVSTKPARVLFIVEQEAITNGD